jgi:hypothetical protein
MLALIWIKLLAEAQQHSGTTLSLHKPSLVRILLDERIGSNTFFEPAQFSLENIEMAMVKIEHWNVCAKGISHPRGAAHDPAHGPPFTAVDDKSDCGIGTILLRPNSDSPTQQR